MPERASQAHQGSDAATKIALFRSLFRGRDDVYARRFESLKSGKSGYAPACANEWVRGICEKPRIQCARCRHRKFLPITDESIRWHLTGIDHRAKPFVLGLYPMLLDETCWFLAVDFDGQDWLADATAYLQACLAFSVPAALERSRSGNGGHVWLFFSEPIPAQLARQLGAWLLTEAMDSRPETGLQTYDRFFPDQDTLPRGGFGNLIALPLQRFPRDQGNSLFIEPDGIPVTDQWAFLANLPRLPKCEVESRVATAAKNQRILGVRAVPNNEYADAPWRAPPSRRPPAAPPDPEAPTVTLTAVLSDQIYVPKANLTAAARNQLIRLAAFQNPEFYKAQAMRLPTWKLPRIIACAEELEQHIALPRGCLPELKALCRNAPGGQALKLKVRDKRTRGTPIDLTFSGQLRSEQQRAADDLLKHDTGVLAATTAFGKTVLAAYLIAARGVNTLILVHRRQLMEQWVERLTEFLDLPARRIGRLGGGRRKLRGEVDIALLQSVVRKGVVHDALANYGQIIVDECHHVSARNFELALRRAPARYILGLSATVCRKDGHHPIIFMQCGPVRHQVQARDQARDQNFSREVLVRPTSFQAGNSQENEDRRVQFQALCSELMNDPHRNQRVVSDVKTVVEHGRAPLVLTERTQHLEALAVSMRKAELEVLVLRGGMGKKALRATMDRMTELAAAHPPDADPLSRSCGAQRFPVVLATGKFVGEGFDAPWLDTLFLTLPISWKGTVAQYVGRLHREHTGKRTVQVYDYADLQVPMLSRMFDRRCRGYEAAGYTILLPASALPGWPQSVPLPIDPVWKQAYAASVRRLIRDGVDVPLAKLFVEMARVVDASQEGEARARSASEAFLLRRLESLEATRGCFRLNQRLPITFRGFGWMEVDFLDAKRRIVIELDGDQHLDSPEAYRRDREKDRLLQEQGYWVLRFLATDLGRYLDDILDAILRTLAQRARRSDAGES